MMMYSRRYPSPHLPFSLFTFGTSVMPLCMPSCSLLLVQATQAQPDCQIPAVPTWAQPAAALPNNSSFIPNSQSFNKRVETYLETVQKRKLWKRFNAELLGGKKPLQIKNIIFKIRCMQFITFSYNDKIFGQLWKWHTITQGDLPQANSCSSHKLVEMREAQFSSNLMAQVEFEGKQYTQGTGIVWR